MSNPHRKIVSPSKTRSLTGLTKMADWANLPMDILALISEQMEFKEELICFSVVCKSWLSVQFSLKEKVGLLPCKLPCLMLPELELDEENGTSKNGTKTRRFLHLSTKEVTELELPEIQGKKCFGVNHGWVYTLGEDLHVNLFHPFSKQQIPLPPYGEDPSMARKLIDICITKVALSKHPKEQECVVMTICGDESSKLAYARPGDEVWRNLPAPTRYYDDTIYYKDRFYVVDNQGVLMVCNLDGDEGPKSTIIASSPELFPYSPARFQNYLVESSGELLLVRQVRILSCRDDINSVQWTTWIDLYKLEKNVPKGSMEPEYPFCWVELESLGGNTLFLGNNLSVSLPASEFYGCFKANCVYYAAGNPKFYEKEKYARLDNGFFDVERKFNGIIIAGGISVSRLSPPIWIT